MAEEEVDLEGVEVRLAEFDLPALGLPLQLLEVVRPLRLPDEVESLAAVLVFALGAGIGWLLRARRG